MATNGQYWQQFNRRHSISLNLFDRNAEIIFGLIMVLTFTCSISAANAGREEVRTIIWAAIGCNTAWGLVDAIMYLLAILMERSDSLRLLREVQQAAGQQEAARSVKSTLAPLLAETISEGELAYMAQKIKLMPAAPPHAYLQGHDLKMAGLVFLLVFISTFPVVLPFFFISDPIAAIRVSNGIALLLLFGFGYRLGLMAGYNKWMSGLVFACIGSVLVWVTIMLGG